MFALLIGLKNTFKEHVYLFKEVFSIKLKYAFYINFIELLTAFKAYIKELVKTVENCKIKR